MRQGPLDIPKLRTWSHLSGQKRKPSEYEIVSVDIHYHNDNNGEGHQLQSLSPDAPINKYYREYMDGCPLHHPHWGAFRDPDELTYRTYNIVQEGQERYVEELLNRFNGEGHDASLTEDWLNTLARLYAPGRYLMHTVQMASAYGAQISPTSTISICSAFQAADALRWVSHISYRTIELGKLHGNLGFGTTERVAWETDPAWQGFRELMERCLTTFDWGEAFVVLNIIAKPAIDEAFVRQFGRAARRNGDHLFALLADAQLKDVDRSRRWAKALMEFLFQHPGNHEIITCWAKKWQPLAEHALTQFCSALDDNICADAIANLKSAQSSMGLVDSGA